MKKTKVIDIELSRPFAPVRDLQDYVNVRALLRWHGHPIVAVTVPISNGQCTARDLNSALTREITTKVMAVVLRTQVSDLDGRTLNQLLRQKPTGCDRARFPSISVAVCTRDRADDLRACLNALCDLEEEPLEVIVVDNAPKTNATREVVEAFQRSLTGSRTKFRYVVEPKPGLDWARNRAIAEACGEIVAFTDDDVIVDVGWTRALSRVFAEDADVMGVTGLVEPYELESEAQNLFEELGGFGRGYDRRWFHTDAGDLVGWAHGGAGKFGTGANMAFRRCLFQKIGTFDPALDVGTATRGGGDLEMFFRVLKTGHTLVYEPAALVRHRHRTSYGALYNQIRNNGVGFYSYLTRCMREYPEERRGFVKMSWWYFWKWNLPRCRWSFWRPGSTPTELYRAELAGSLVGLFQYKKARKVANQLGGADDWKPKRASAAQSSNELISRRPGVAVRTIDVKEGLRDLTDVREYSSVRLFVLWNGTPLGCIEIENRFHPITAAEVGDVVVQYCFFDLFQLQQNLDGDQLLARFEEELRKVLGIKPAPTPLLEADPMRVSVVVATYDRPKDLRQCLGFLCAQKTRHDVELIVVDNHPQSGLTPPVVADFPQVKLITEPRAGLAYARNAGFRACTGDVAVATDDDVTMPPDWLEKIVSPFAHADVMGVTGVVLPAELETEWQIAFETYGGLGKGFERRRFDRSWFDSYGRRAVKTWDIGATANAAFRVSALRDPKIGFMDEALGPGMPSGVGEDTYLFYRILKAGYAIIYEPAAYVWHRHRRESQALSRQIYNYAKGHAAYNLVTFQRDRDWRGLTRIFAEIPIYFCHCLRSWVLRRRAYPLRLILTEIRGHFVGPFSVWLSRRRVAKLNRQYSKTNQTPSEPMQTQPLPVHIEAT